MVTIAEFNDNHGFNVKLTNEKIFIDAAGSSETIALRGLNGVGLYDDLEKYNLELETAKGDKKASGCIRGGFHIFGVAYIIFSISYINSNDILTFVLIGLFFGVIPFIYDLFSKDAEKPVLDSYFRLMLSGGDRKFPFNKSDETSVKIADFINKVEDTLTAYK